MDSPRFISFSGKGGSGKTTTASLFLNVVLRKGLARDILVIDADPDSNLSETLHAQVPTTLGQVLDMRKRSLEDPGEKSPKLRFLIWEAISPGQGFDLLVMGRSTGQGCYCSVNAVLNAVLEETVAKYDLVLIDFDAGLEHFSRRTGHPADTLLITCDPSRMSFDTARRIRALVDELSLPYDRRYLIGCRFQNGQEGLFAGLAEETGHEILGLIPYDPEIAARNLEGQDLLSLAPDNPSLLAVEKMVGQLMPTA